MKVLPPPGPVRTRQLVLLAVLLAVAVYAVSRMLATEPAGPGAPASNTQTRAVPPPAAPTGMPQPLELGKLESASEPPTTTRNPFRFGAQPAPPTPPAPPAFVPPARPPGFGSSPGGSTGEPIRLQFVGRVVMPNQEIVAVLTDDRGNHFEGTAGQIIDGRYRIVRVGEESLVIEYVNGTGRTTLQLRGNLK